MIQPVTGEVTGVLTNRCDGYDYNHEGIDIVAPQRRVIVAAYAGTVTASGDGGGYGIRVDISHGSGYLTRYAHMVETPLVSVGQWVEKGAPIGLVGSTGNSTANHLHFEVWYNGNNSLIGPGYSCGQTVTQGQPIGVDFPNLSSGARAFSLRNDGMLQGKDSTYGSVLDVRANAVSADADGDTLAVVESNGTAWVKRGALTSGWVQLASNAKKVAVDGDRFVVLQTNGVVQAKDGLFSSNWVTLITGISDIDADAGRVGARGNDGTLVVKEGGLSQSWITVQTATSDFALDGLRIGVVTGGLAKVKEGAINAAWVNQAAADQIELAGSRIALRSGSTVNIKEGSLYAGWTTVSTSTSDVALSGNRIAIVQNGMVRLKIGAVNAAWVDAFSSSNRVFLN